MASRIICHWMALEPLTSRFSVEDGHQVAVVGREVEPDPVGVLGAEGRVHLPEVAERPRGEVVACRGLRVEGVERRQVVRCPHPDGDARLGGLLDVAPPELVHPGEDVVCRPARQGQLEDEAWLPGGEPTLGGLLPPAS
jgi:hypothetical protein